MYKHTGERLILASSSPRRRSLMAELGLQPEIIAPDCNEDILQGERAPDMVLRLSVSKAQSVAKGCPEAWVIGADTTVLIDGKILGKPEDSGDAARMLRQLAGNWHEVWGGIALVNLSQNVLWSNSFVTRVFMRKLRDQEIAEFIATGEPMDKAGAYAIQGIGSALIQELHGSYTNVVGLNVCALVTELLSRKIIR